MSDNYTKNSTCILADGKLLDGVRYHCIGCKKDIGFKGDLIHFDKFFTYCDKKDDCIKKIREGVIKFDKGPFLHYPKIKRYSFR
jgi:hypothetical protein